MKVCADVIESLLGMIYLKFGYSAAVEVAQEFGVSLHVAEKLSAQKSKLHVTPRRLLMELVSTLTRKISFENPGLVEEALTHCSALCCAAKYSCLRRGAGQRVSFRANRAQSTVCEAGSHPGGLGPRGGDDSIRYQRRQPVCVACIAGLWPLARRSVSHGKGPRKRRAQGTSQSADRRWERRSTNGSIALFQKSPQQSDRTA